jgi:hypothetical protein
MSQKLLETFMQDLQDAPAVSAILALYQRS